MTIRIAPIVAALLAAAVSLSFGQETEETSTAHYYDADPCEQCSVENIRKVSRSEWQKFISGDEFSESVRDVIKSEKKMDGACLKSHDFTGRYNAALKTCSICKEGGCSNDTACSADCVVPLVLQRALTTINELEKIVDVILKESGANITKLVSELAKEEAKTDHCQGLANSAIGLACFSFMGLVVLVVVSVLLFLKLRVRIERIAATKPQHDANQESSAEKGPEGFYEALVLRIGPYSKSTKATSQRRNSPLSSCLADA